MRKPSRLVAASTLGAALLFGAAARSHVSVSGPAFAGERQVLTFTVGHGCEGADTFRIQLDIPAEVTSVRALPGPFGEAELVKDDAGLVSQVIWTKDTVRDADDHIYQLAIRITVPEAPFTTLYFPATQSCRTPGGEETVVAWAALPGGDPEAEPAPALVVLPPRAPGWNKYTVPARIEDLSLFDDAQIVWAGDAAYSKNPTTMELIRAEADVEELSAIEAGSEIWVKY